MICLIDALLTALGDALEQKNSHLNGREERVVLRVRMRVSGARVREKSTNDVSGDMVNDALGGVPSILVERLLSKTGRGTSTPGFSDYSWCVCDRDRFR